LFKHMHHREQSPMPEELFLEQVADCFLTLEEYDVYWKCYVDLCRYHQQRVQPCVFHTDFVKRSPQDYACTMAQRGDVEGLDILCHHFTLAPCWEWIDLLPCTLEPRYYLHLIPWNDDNMEERLVAHIQRRFRYTGQVSQSLTLVSKAFQYLSHEKEFPKLKELRDEYMNLSTCEPPTETVREEERLQENERSESPLSNSSDKTHTLPKKRRRRLDRRTLYLEESLKTWQEAACNAQHEVEELGREQSALCEQVSKLQAQVSGVHRVANLIQSFVHISKEMNTHDESVLKFFQDLHMCLESLGDDSDFVSQDVLAQKQAMHVAKLERHLVELKNCLTESQKKENTDDVLRQDVNQVSFSSVETLESTTESDEIQQWRQTVRRLEKQLIQEACEHDMERTGDKAQIEYLLEMLEDSSKTSIFSVSPMATNDKLVLALEVSEARRARAVEHLQCERELYAEKMKQLMLAVKAQEQQGE